MATGSDALLEHLLFQVALSGDQGLGIKALSDAFIAFHAKTHFDEEVEENSENDDIDILFSLKPPGSKSNAHSQASDPQHVEKLWSWLIEQPDIDLKQGTDSEDAATLDNNNPLYSVLQSHANERLHTTENRVWYALTDHDVDWKRIPKLEFQCLQVIAAQGPGGILQPDVTRLTGQDKRSVPKRTAALADKGYITKEQCLGGGLKTSLLRLKKFTPDVSQHSTYIDVKTEAGKGESKGPTLRMVHYETWYNEVITNLKKHGNIMAYEDLRKEMGIHGRKWETRALHRCMRRLDKAGCIQRLKARLDLDSASKAYQGNLDSEDDANLHDDDGNHDDGQSPLKPRPRKKSRWVRCIKLMREPTENDKDAFTSSVGVTGKGKTLDDQEESEAEAEYDDFAEVDVAVLSGAVQASEVVRRIPAQWQPSMHHTQFIFHLIDSAGTKGLSTMDLADCGMGHLWRRPLDELIGRLTDVWTVSQPLHLRHLAVVRDTAFANRTSHYIFRSFANYKKLVERGEAAWEAIDVDLPEIDREPELDAWGFPQVKASGMVGPEGIGNMASCKNTLTKPTLKRHIFDKNDADLYAPKGKKSAKQGSVPTTPNAKALATRNALANAGTLVEYGVPVAAATPPTKQYKKNLWQMNPKRVEAELNEWKARARKLAESRARVEFGITPVTTEEPESPNPKRRRTRKKADTAATSSSTVDPDQSAVPEASKASTTPSEADSPALEASTVNTAISEHAVGSSTEKFPDSHGQPSAQPERQTNGKSSAHSDFQNRVVQIEQEILNKAKPSVYINPPGSGQMKNSTFLPRGRPSKYMVAVFKSDKLKDLPWFNEENDRIKTALRAQGFFSNPQSAIEETAAESEASPSSVQEPFEGGQGIIIRNGTRALKRKARESLRERVAKKLATEVSFNQPSPSSSPLPRTQTLNSSPEDVAPVNSAEKAPIASSFTSINYVLPPTNAGPKAQPNIQRSIPEVNGVQRRPSETNTGHVTMPIEIENSLPVPATVEEDSVVAIGTTAEETADAQVLDQPMPTQSVPDQHSNTRSTAIPPSDQQTYAGVPDTNLLMTDAPQVENEAEGPSVRATPYPSIVPPLNESPTPSHVHRPRVTKKVGVGRSGGNVSFNREKIVLELIHKHGGMFGGDRELFYPFVTGWEREYNKRPDRHTLDRLLAALVADGRLKRISFSFQAASGTVADKSIIMEPEIDPESPEVQDLKQRIIDHYPISYIPDDAELAPDLRKHVEADFRNIYVKRAADFPTVKSYFPKDNSVFVSRIHQPAKVQLGMTEASLQSGVFARRRRREEEERRQQRYMQAQMAEEDDDDDDEAEVDDAQAALQGEIQLKSYQHDPERAFVDRGPYGRRRLAKLQRWGAEENQHQLPKRALGLLTAHEQDQAEKNSMEAAAASQFGLLKVHKAVDRFRPFKVPANDVHQAHFERPTQPPGTLASVLQDAAPTFRVIEAVSFMSPYQRFHPQSGTFSTDPVIITTSSKPSEFGFVGEQRPMSLTDIFKQAGEEASMLGDIRGVTQAPLVAGEYHEAPRLAASTPLAAFAQRYPLITPTPRPRKNNPTARPLAPALAEYRAYQQRLPAQRANRNGIFSMSDREEQRLIYAVVAVRTLTGGLEQHTNWGLVHQVFHYKLDPNYCRHRWSLLRHKHAGTVEKLQVEFRKLFVEAYERGEVPDIDFMEPEKYDWLAIVTWAESKLQTPLSNGFLELPKDRQTLETRFNVKNTTDVYNIGREDFWAAHVTHLRREELASNWTYVRPLTKQSSVPSTEDELMLAKSWVRANVVTPDSVYDSNAAHYKLVQIENDLPRSLEELLGAKIIRMENKGRTIPGRNYDISDQVLMAFKRQWDITFLKATAEYKSVVDDAFARDGKIAIEYHATDPQWTAMTNLVSNGRAKVVPMLPPVSHNIGAPWPRLSKWGFTEGNYKTVHMDKSRLHFDLELRPTDTYISGYPISPLPIPLSKQFPGERGPRLPLWTDINGDIISVYWDMVLMATLWLLAFRPGLTAEAMAKGAYKGKLWAWELDLFFEWAEKSGFARRLQVEGGGEPGWTAGEWWWLAFAEEIRG